MWTVFNPVFSDSVQGQRSNQSEGFQKMGGGWDKKKAKDEKKWRKRSKFGCVNGFEFKYDLSSPSFVRELPEGEGDLNTVSGICFEEKTGCFLLVEDKTGLVTSWNAANNTLVWQEKPSIAGDYEDIAVDNEGRIILLNTNGNLVIRSSQGNEWRSIHIPGLTRQDNCEGLAIVGKDKLFIACKGEDLAESKKRIYEVDLAAERLNPIPKLKISLEEISDVLGSEIDEFNPSGLAVHPLFPNQIYVIATSGQLLVVVNIETSRVLCAVHLPRDLFVQPEGICFTKDGSLLICNEGRAKEGGPGVGTVVKFEMKS